MLLPQSLRPEFLPPRSCGSLFVFENSEFRIFLLSELPIVVEKSRDALVHDLFPTSAILLNSFGKQFQFPCSSLTCWQVRLNPFMDAFIRDTRAVGRGVNVIGHIVGRCNDTCNVYIPFGD